MTRGSASWKIYHNPWYSNSKWFALTEAPHQYDYMEQGVSVNTAIIEMPVANLTSFVSTLKAGVVPGVTLLLDFPFPAYPDNQGHWAEITIPAYCVLVEQAYIAAVQGGSGHISQVLIPNLRKHALTEWFQAVLQLAVAPGLAPGSGPLPTLIDAGDMGRVGTANWVRFQALLVVTDRYTHPDRLTGYPSPEHGDVWKHDGCERFVSRTWMVGFTAEALGGAFRQAAYEHAGWAPPAGWSQGQPPALPKTITWLSNAGDAESVDNKPEFRAMLQSVADDAGWRLRARSISSKTSFVSYIAAMADTGLLVSRHGPLLANAVFLPPGAMVMELLAYNWEWQKISRLYYNTTQSMGDVHHFAWRASDPRWAAYRKPSDSRYNTWTAEECSSKECLVVHARAGMVADVDTIGARLRSLLGKVTEGVPVSELREEWPKA